MKNMLNVPTFYKREQCKLRIEEYHIYFPDCDFVAVNISTVLLDICRATYVKR